MTAVKLLPVTEKEFADQIVGPKGLATYLGWSHVHFRAAQTAKGWRTPVNGPLGTGWPDYVLCHPVQGRTLLRELKTAVGKVSPEQESVLAFLRAAGLDADVWRPGDLDSGRIERELRA